MRVSFLGIMDVCYRIVRLLVNAPLAFRRLEP
jgi:hypothetical protein